MPTITPDPVSDLLTSRVPGQAPDDPGARLPDEALGHEDHLLFNPGSLYTEPVPAFYIEMRRRVDRWFSDRGLTKYAPPSQIWKGLAGLAIALVAYVLVVTETVPRWAMLPLCMISGMSLFIFAMSVAHDGCHGAISSKRSMNKLACLAYDIAGVSSYITNIDHMKGHHRAPNVDGIDVAIGSDVEPTFRLHPDMPHYPWHRLQHLYFPFAYALSTIHKWFILDYAEIFHNRWGVRSGRHDARRKLAIALSFKAFTMFWAIGVPLMVMNVTWWEVGLGVVFFHLLPGTLVGLTFQLTHISEGNLFPSLDPEGHLHTSRALHTLETNLDIMPASRWLNALSCGLTLHVTHHLFPEIAHAYLPDISPIVEETAREYGVPYKKHTTIASAVAAHYRVLKQLGQPSAAGVKSMA
jgi:linoleoyl-CoA desaturase